MPDDWPGHPQRKDYPLGGIPVEYKGAHRPAARRAEVVQLMTTHDQDTDSSRHRRRAPVRRLRHLRPRGRRGRPVFNASGGDWDDLVDEATALDEERIVVNMGPQHPSTHGVLRLILELDGETVTEARAGIGYLHTGIEKNMEFRTWTQGVTFCTRMDYLTPMFQEAAYCLGRRAAARHHRPDPRAGQHHPRADDGAHPDLLAPGRLGTGGMEMGATTVMTVGFRERERILRIIEMITGLRMNNAYIRPGGVAQDLPPGAIDMVRDIVPAAAPRPRRARAAAQREPVLKGRTVGRRLPRPHRLHGAGHHRPGAALHRPAARPAQVAALLRLRDLRLRRHDARQLRRLRPAAHPASTRCTSR